MSLYIENLDNFVSKLEDNSIDYQEKHSLFSELCDTLETYIGANEYEYFLNKLLKVFFEHLKTVPISFVSNSLEQKLRYLILDIIMRLPTNDIHQPFVFDIYDNLIKVLKEDNEENGVRCTKIINTLHKSYKNYLSSKSEDYLQLLISIYKNMPQVIDENFGGSSTENFDENNDINNNNNNNNDDDDENTSKVLLKATHSLKVAAECPVNLVSLYNIYTNLVVTIIPEFLPLVIDLMSLQAAEQKKEHQLAKAENRLVTYVSPKIQNRHLYNDLILCQIKAAFFLAFVLIKKLDISSIEDRQKDIPDYLIRLLQDCPSESALLRKELLYAIRHTLTTDLKNLYSSKFDLLFNEKVLLGDSLTARETLRPIGYTIVADFVHLNDDLLPDQIWKSVETFCAHLRDDSLSQNVYIMSAKLMLNLVDRISKMEKTKARQLFLIMIDSFSKRFASVNQQYDDIIIQHEEYVAQKNQSVKKLIDLENISEEVTGKPLSENKISDVLSKIKSDDEMDIDKPDSEKYFSFEQIDRNLPIQLSQPHTQDPLESAKYMFKMFMTFLRSILVAFKSCNPDPGYGLDKTSWNECARLINIEELHIFQRLFRETVDCLRLFQSCKLSVLRSAMQQAYDSGGLNPPITSCKEEKDLMELLATLFIQLEPAAFNEVLEPEMPHLFNAILQNPALLHIPQYFFANEMTTANFSSILIVFCISKLPELGEIDVIKCNVLNRLFKFCFMSVTLFPAQNESVLIPHVNNLILRCLELSTTAKDPLVYFYLIRTLFRAIGGGKFEALYKEILRIMQVLLECLGKLFMNSRRQVEKDVYADLCLTVPVRLSALIPYLHHLMKPLVHALNGSPDLVTQGLRTLELCVDNMNMEFMEPIIEPVIADIMKALCKHLRPIPYSHQHSHTALRILGKMGGRNRNFFDLHADLMEASVNEQDLKGLFKIEGIPNEVPVSMTAAISSALTALRGTRPKVHYRISAFNYLTSILKLFMNINEIPNNYDEKVQQVVDYITNQGKDEIDSNLSQLPPDDTKDVAKLDRQGELLVELLKALFFSVSLDDVKDEAQVLIEGICRHYVLLCLSRTTIDHFKMARPFSVKNHEGENYLNEDTIFEAIAYALGHYNSAVREVGMKAIHIVYDSCVTLFGSTHDALKFWAIKKMCSTFLHCCFKDPYYEKLSGCIGLQVMIKDLGIPYEYFSVRQIEIARAMFFVLRDTPVDVPSEVCTIAKNITLDILKNCNKEISREQVFQQPFQNLISQIVYDLSNHNSNVRETSQNALKVLSEVTGVPISPMISQSKAVLLAPIFGKPLRALPFHMQIGNIDAITYCLGLNESFLEFNDELNRLLSEALALVDAEDESLITVNKVTEYNTTQQLVSLRVVCIELLSLALTKPEFSNSTVRNRILSVFFKTLRSTSQKTIDATFKGLSIVLSDNAKLPKELLQEGLRPMLVNLSDFKKLTVEGLDALCKLLTLLITYFKVEVGRKLLNHLMSWADASNLQRIIGQKLETNETVKVMCGILEIFHLLPEQAYEFMDELVEALLFIEKNLRRRQNSPFRIPLAKFFNRFPDRSVEYFLKRVNSRIHGSVFAGLLKMESTDSLRNQLKVKIDEVVDSIANESNDESKITMFTNLIYFIDALAEKDPIWFGSTNSMLLKLRTISIDCITMENGMVLDSPAHFQLDQALFLFQSLIVKSMANDKNADETIVFINYLHQNNLTITKETELFLFNEIVKSDDMLLIKDYLTKIIGSLSGSQNLLTKTFLLTKIVIPTLFLKAKLGKGDLLVRDSESYSEWINNLLENVWKNITDEKKIESCENDRLRVQIMQLTSVIVEYYPDIATEYKKDIIKFNWNCITLEDSISKQVAYVSIAYFIKAFDTPSKLIIPVFVALLKTNQSEVRFLVKQSLDLMASCLTKRLGSDTEWLKWTRRVLSENGYLVTQVLNVYQLIVNHSDLFYVARDQFIPNVITAMGKLTILTNPMTENQILAMELAELILKWEISANKEKDRQSALVSEDLDAMDVDEKPEITRTSVAVPNGQKETCITFLIRYVCLCHQRASDNELSRKALNILHALLSPKFWSDVGVKLVFLEKMLGHAESQTTSMQTCCVNALEALNVVLEWQPSSWILENLNPLRKMLDQCIRSHNQDIQEPLQNVLSLILKALQEEGSKSEENKETCKGFLSYLIGIITEDLASANSVAAAVTLSWTVAQFEPEAMDQNLQLMIRTLGKLVKDHIALSQSSKHVNSADFGQLTEEAKMTSKLLEKILSLCAMRITVLSEQRRVYLSLVVQLIDKSHDKQLLTKIAEIVRGWIFDKDQIVPSSKEKAGVLSKMMMYELKNDPELTNLYYQIIVDTFKEQSLAYSELTFRLEHPFLVGTKISDTGIRQELMNILGKSIDKDIRNRLFYVIREQNWEYLSEYPWLNQASQILYGSFDPEYKLKLDNNESTLPGLQQIVRIVPKIELRTPTENVQSMLNNHVNFLEKHINIKAKDLLEPLLDLSYQSPEAIHNSWCNLFPVAYNAIPAREKADFLFAFVTLLSKDYHMRQQESVPNVIHIMLSAAGKCPDLQLPPHLVKYLGMNYDSWYPAIRILEQIDSHPISDNTKIKELNKDALVEVYSTLQEDDMFYGLWRRRSKYVETNAALSYEQIGMWDKALKMYEAAQIKARSGALPFSESEYALWEDDWILCAEKLQYWEILTELAKHEGFTDLLLECGWRIADWIKDKEPLEQSVKTVMDVPTPRRQMFQTFLSLQAFSQNEETPQNVQKLIDEGIQLSLRKWWKLPQRITTSHISLLHTFQQYVEFSEATQIYRSLQTTNQDNLDSKSQDLKRVLQAWRERLPNTWDDINLWNDLVTWRRHAFDVINKFYLPLLPQQSGNSTNNSYAYRGYHEIAWVINRFAHIARKQNMPDVCINQLAKIYTLPNIEVQEAFLKLREQAKCHYHNPKEISTGLDVISNTNLVYFAAQHKAEFITLKGMFLAKLGNVDDANSSFAAAVQTDLNLPNSWAEWGFFNDRRFKETGDISYAKHAISCYLQASSLYKSNKARRLLCRILWLVSLDNASGTLCESFLGHKGDIPVWHWVTFTPQLLLALSHKEYKVASEILLKIAKSYPQALHFQLRTSRDEYINVQRQVAQQMHQANSSAGSDANTPVNETPSSNQNGTPAPNATHPLLQRKPWTSVENISRVMKSAYPLLTLSLESFVDQINQRFKVSADAEAYRLIVALYHDSIHQFSRLQNPRENNKLPQATEVNLRRFADTVMPKHIKAEFVEDIIQSKPNLEEYISKLMKWKTCMEEKLDRNYSKINLERVCPHLSQFHHQKFEDIDIPGQYLLNKESNQGFIKIERFMPTISTVREAMSVYKRLTIRGTDGSLHTFTIQCPAPRTARREEKMFQMFRLFNDQLNKSVQTKRRHIQFTLPLIVPLSPHVRMVSDDEKYINMYSIYENICKVQGKNKDEPLAFTIEKIRSAYDPRLPKPDILNVKTEILSAIQTMFVPNTMMKEYFMNYYPKFEDFWVFRKQFASQYSSVLFATYMMAIHNRQPQKIHVNKSSGKVYTSDMLPFKIASGKSNSTIMQNTNMDVSDQRAAPVLATLESVPFRLTPNIQELIGAVGTEGILSMHMVLIAQSLGDSFYDIDHFLNLFVRDEVLSYYAQLSKNIGADIPHLQEIVRVNVESIIKRIISVSNTENQSAGVSSQFAVNLIAHAVNPRHLANCDSLWMPYF
ncbi:histone acetyltransferase [Martiniozyma asiatica (nom. inval.)]|nr:histone acetyltransferase [Martiniozyma asiatica]